MSIPKALLWIVKDLLESLTLFQHNPVFLLAIGLKQTSLTLGVHQRQARSAWELHAVIFGSFLMDVDRKHRKNAQMLEEKAKADRIRQARTI